MTIASPVLQAQVRLARHYLDELREASASVIRSSESRSRWLHQIDQDWGQIKQWQSWTAAGRSREPERAHLCASYSVEGQNVLRLRQTPAEHLAWLEQAFDAVGQVDSLSDAVFNGGAGGSAVAGDAVMRRRLLYQLAHIHMTMGTLDAAERYAQVLHKLALAVDDELGMGNAEFVLGAVALSRSRFDDAERRFRQSLALYESIRAEAEIGRTHQGLGRVAEYRGDYAAACDHYTRYLAIVENSTRYAELSVALLTLSGGLLHLRDYETARVYAERAMQICRSTSFVRILPAALLMLANVEIELGDLDAAYAHGMEGIEKARAIDAKQMLVDGVYLLGRVCWRRDNIDRAFALWSEGLEIARAIRVHFSTFELLHDMAAVSLLNDGRESARGYMEEAVQVAGKLSTEYFNVRLIALAALYVERTDEPERAARWLGLASRFRQHADPHLLNILRANLEAALGVERCRSLREEGAGLAVDAVLGEIRSLFPQTIDNGAHVDG